MSTFVSTSVSIFVYTNFLLVDTFVAHLKFFVAGFVAIKQVFFDFFEFSWATQWPVSGVFRGPLGKPFRSVSMGNLDALRLKISTVLWGSQAPLKPLRHTTGQ